MTYTLPKLNYSYDALEPEIDALTMEIHHTKHHQAYINNLNAALEKHPDFQKVDLVDIVKDLDQLPDDIKMAVRNNGGGHLNHTLFWETLAPATGQMPTGELKDAIDRDFGSFDNLKTELDNAAKTRFGSGWAWLVVNVDGTLEVLSTPNQDNPYSLGKTPILGIDVWEHAYYLNYQNRRPDYIASWFKVINWDQVLTNYQNAK